MPKLNLKKVQQQTTSRKQKSIISFFNKATDGISVPPIVENNLNANKRKSLCVVHENFMAQCITQTVDTKVPGEGNCHKRFKDDYYDEKSKHEGYLSVTSNSKENMAINDIICMEHEKHKEPGQNQVKTPTKLSPIKACLNSKSDKTPKKNSIQESLSSSILNIQEKRSPTKFSFATNNEFDFGHVDDFNDDWNLEEDIVLENLDLCTMQRCEIIHIKDYNNTKEITLKNGNMTGRCIIQGIWESVPLGRGDIVNVIATKNENGQYLVSNTSGLMVLQPDHLVSSTSVVAGVFCQRKAVLQERWRGIDSANTAMIIGILIHELVQKALIRQISDISQLDLETDQIIKDSIHMLYDAGISEEETRTNMQSYIQPLADFIKSYFSNSGNVIVQKEKEKWKGLIDKVLDIEENICCPQLGLKGKIDATLQVTIHDKKGTQKVIVPLELKSGKATVSAEHRGQLILYGMMLSLHRYEDPSVALQRGLLLYLKDRVNLVEVNCGYPERRDLIMLRNQLVEFLASDPSDIESGQFTDIEDASMLLQQRLPDPINNERACSKCPYLTLCSLHLWHSGGSTVSDSHALSKLQGEALGHLSKDHIKYFLHWTALLKMEEKVQTTSSPLHMLWTETAEKREKRGSCIPNLRIKTVTQSCDRYHHTFLRQGAAYSGSSQGKGPQVGEFAIVSIDKRPWIAAGVIQLVNNEEVHIILERDLNKRMSKDTLYYIDSYESYATTVQNLTNIGVLLDNSERSERLRALIIDKTKPEFEIKLPREVGRLGIKLMRSLNVEQTRAVLKALSARDYALLQGLPGTGKTQTISVLIQMLVGLKQRVLVTAHTHSAVDTMLNRLPETIKVMRLGSTSRIASTSLHRAEEKLATSCRTTEDLAKLYDSMEVIGVTCLGSTHAMLSKTTFDMCIVDEATQVLQSTVLRPLFSAKRFVLVGDPEQLPPVVKSRAARRLGMEESLFHRLMNEEATSTLNLQYRMNQAIAAIANQVAYNSRLKCADEQVALAKLSIDMQKLYSKPDWLKKACSPELNDAVLFLDIEPINHFISETCNQSCTNVFEVCLVLDLVKCFIEGGTESKDIGIIAPYREQVLLLRKATMQYSVEVSTVDQFQGRDKSVIIYSCTKQNINEDRKIKEGEILNDQRRLAVSVTRAKHKFLIVGNSNALQRYLPLQKLIEASTTISINKNIVQQSYDKYKRIVM